jgi:hypothetical protein
MHFPNKKTLLPRIQLANRRWWVCTRNRHICTREIRKIRVPATCVETTWVQTWCLKFICHHLSGTIEQTKNQTNKERVPEQVEAHTLRNQCLNTKLISDMLLSYYLFHTWNFHLNSVELPFPTVLCHISLVEQTHRIQLAPTYHFSLSSFLTKSLCGM